MGEGEVVLVVGDAGDEELQLKGRKAIKCSMRSGETAMSCVSKGEFWSLLRSLHFCLEGSREGWSSAFTVLPCKKQLSYKAHGQTKP